MRVKDPHAPGLALRYRRRLIRKKLQWRAFRSRHDLILVSDRPLRKQNGVLRDAILGFAVVRNESQRLPHFLDHYRKLGVQHFLMVDNASTDGSRDILLNQPDVSLWGTTASYKSARFGMDWVNWLMMRYATGHWCVVADLDEILVYPDWETRDLSELTTWLDHGGHRTMGAIMLDMYPKGPPDAQTYHPGQNPMDVLSWFDAYGYRAQRLPKLDCLWLQGGVRDRKFFEKTPDKAPTLNKIPLIKRHRGDEFVNSTHSALPSALNHTWKTPVSGALLHTKFLPGTAERAREERKRGEHFQVSEAYSNYYQSLTGNPDLWDNTATKFTGWQQLVDLGLIERGDW